MKHILLKHLSHLCTTVFLFLIFTLSASAQSPSSTICLSKFGTDPYSHPYNIATCYDSSFLHVQIVYQNLSVPDFIQFEYMPAMLLVNISSTGFIVLNDLVNHKIKFTDSSASTNGTISFDIELVHCLGTSVGPFVHTFIYDASTTNPISALEDTLCSLTVTAGAGAGNVGLNLIQPKVEFTSLPLTGTVFNSLSSENNSHYVKFETNERYYLLRATSGITDFFRFNIHAEKDIDILSIHAININGDTLTNNLIAGNPIFGNSNDTIVFTDSLIELSALNDSGITTNNHFLFGSQFSADSSDCILIKEIFRMVDVAYDAACGFLESTSGYQYSTYKVEIDCDENAATPACYTSTGSLNVDCKMLTGTLAGIAGSIALQIIPTDGISLCADSTYAGAELKISVKNNYPGSYNGLQVGSGTVELENIAIPINSLYFSFDSILLGNNPNHIPYVMSGSGANSFALINANDLPDPLDGSLDTMFSSNFPIPADSAFRYFHLNDTFNLRLMGLKFNCFGDSGRLQTTTPPLTQLFSYDGNQPYAFWFKRECSIGDTTTPFEFLNFDSINVKNNYNGTVGTWTDATDISTDAGNSVANLEFTYSPVTPSIDPWILSEQNGHVISNINSLLDCDSTIFSAEIAMSVFFQPTDTTNIFMVINTATNDTAIIPDSLVSSAYNSDTTFVIYQLNYGFIDSFNIATARLAFSIMLNTDFCAGSNFGLSLVNCEFRARCATCDDCYRLLGKNSLSFFRHCPGECDSKVNTHGFTFNRSTFGWLSDSSYLAHDAPIDSLGAATLNLNIKGLYECDHVQAIAPGFVSGWFPQQATLNFEMAYTPPDSLLPTYNIFQFEHCTFTFTPDSLGYPAPFDSAFSVTLNSTNATVTVDTGQVAGIGSMLILKISIPDSTMLDQYPAIPFYNALDSLSTADSIIRSYSVLFNGDFSVHDNNNLTPTFYPLSQVRAQFTYSPDSLHPDFPGALLYSCDPYGDMITFLKLETDVEYNAIMQSSGYTNSLGNAIQTYNNGTTTNYQFNLVAVPHCLIRYFFLANVIGGYPGQDDFPNEFRPYFMFPDTAVFDLANPYNSAEPFTIDSAWYIEKISSGSWLTPIPSLDTVHQITGTNLIIAGLADSIPLFPVLDKDGNDEQGMIINFRRTCSDIDASIDFNIADFKINDKAYSPDNNCMSVVALDTILDLPTDVSNDNIILATASLDSVIIANAQNMTIPMQFMQGGNTTGNSLDYAWLYFTTNDTSGTFSLSNFDATINAPTNIPWIVTQPQTGLYKFEKLPNGGNNFINAGNFDLNINLGMCDDSPMVLIAHYGYTCHKPYWDSLAFLTNTTTPDSAHWNTCTEITDTFTILPLAPNMNLSAQVEIADSGLACNYLYFHAQLNTGNTFLGNNKIYLLPPVGFAFDTAISYATVDSPAMNIPIGLPDGFDTVTVASNPILAAWWSIDSLLAPTQFVNMQMNFYFGFKQCCTDDSSAISTVVVSPGPCNIIIYSGDGYATLPASDSTNNLCCNPSCASITLQDSVINACGGGCTGQIFITASGGDSSYYYSWSTGASSYFIDNLCAGTYYVTVHDGNFIAAIDTIVIDSIVPMNDTLVVTNTTCFENNGAIDLTVTGGTSPLIYDWSNGESTEDLDSIGMGNYVVSITDSNGCFITDSITVYNSSIAFIIMHITASDLTLCGDSTTEISVTPSTGGYTYLWSTGDTTTTIEVSEAGIYSVSISLSGCTLAFDSIEIGDCCNPSSIDTLPHTALKYIIPNTYTGNYLLPYYVPSAGLTATYFVGDTVIFKGINLKCEHDVQIRIKDSAMLVIENDSLNTSVLHGCDSLWKGILIMPGGNLIIDGVNYSVGNVRISDCDRGITVNNNDSLTGNAAIFTINHATFQNNERGIDVTPFQNGLHPGTVTGSTFESVGPWLPASTVGATNDIDTLNRLGMNIGFVREAAYSTSDTAGGGIIIGDLGADGNYFQKLSMGIKANNSVVETYNSFFQHIDSTGIDFKGGSLQPTYLYVIGCAFDSMYFGINFHDTQHPNSSTTYLSSGLQLGLLVRENKFYHNTFDINGNLNKRYRQEILSNESYDFKEVSIKTNQLSPPSGTGISFLLINDNAMYLSNPLWADSATIGIAMFSNNIHSLVSTVTRNTIKGVMQGVVGYSLGKGSSISGNQIAEGMNATIPSSADTSDGIFLNGCYGTTVNGNYISSNWDSGIVHSDYGTYFSGVKNNELSANTIQNASTSSYYHGNCLESNLYCNTFLGYDTTIVSNPKGGGVWLENVPQGKIGISNSLIVPGQQRWVISTTPYSAYDTIQPADNTWDNDVDTTVRIVVNGGTNGSKLFWFHRSSPPEFTAHQIIPNGTGLPLSSSINPMGMDSISLCTGSSVFMRVRSEEERDALFKPAKDNLLEGSTTQEYNLVNYYADNDAYRGLNPDSGWLNLGTIDDNDYQLYYDSLTETNIGKFETVEHLLREDDIDGARSANESITTSNIIEATTKTVNAIHFKLLENDSAVLDNADKSALMGIANQNAYYYGESVFTARAILNVVIHEPSVDLSEYRFEESEIPVTPKKKITSPSLHPNPNDGNFVVECSLNKDAEGSVEIFDMLGRRLLAQKIISAQTKIDISHLSAGLYNVRISVGGFITNDKVTVIK